MANGKAEKKPENAKMAEDVAKEEKPSKKDEAKMAENPVPEKQKVPELAFVKIAYLASQQIDIQTSPNMTFGMAVELLEAAVQKLKSAPLKY